MRYVRRRTSPILPLTPVEVDWSTPYTRELVLAWTPAQKERNLANGRTFVAANGVLDSDSNSFGEGCKVASGSTSFTYSDSLSGPTSKTEFTVVVASRPDGTRTGGLVSFGAGTGSNGNYILLTSSVASSIQWKIFDTVYQIMNSTFTVGGLVKKDIVVGALNSVAGSKREMWIDGTLDNALASGITTGNANNNFAFLFGDPQFTSRQSTTPINLVLAWNRALAREEMTALTANPWTIFKAKPLTLAFDTSQARATGLAQRWFLTH